MNYKRIEQELHNRTKKDKEVLAIFRYGSYARKENYRDIDICLVLDKEHPNLYIPKKRLQYLKEMPDLIDLEIFQQLPVYIRIRILKKVRLSFVKMEKKYMKQLFKQ